MMNKLDKNVCKFLEALNFRETLVVFITTSTFLFWKTITFSKFDNVIVKVDNMDEEGKDDTNHQEFV
jgi:hypothetical protein